MGIHLMENFDITDTANADIKASLAAKGILFGGTGPTATTLVKSTVVENGITRPVIGESSNLAAGRFNYIRVPIPASKSFYLSFRVRWVPTTVADTGGLRLYMTHRPDMTNMTAANSYGFVQWSTAANKWVIYNGWTAASDPNYQFGINDWIMVEIYRAPDGTVKMWVEDNLIYNPTRAVIPDASVTENYVNIGRGQPTGASGGAVFTGWQFSDIVVVDPATTGQQYRVGKDARVLTAPYSADIIKEWTTDPSQSLPHNQMMSQFKAAPGTVDLLSTVVEGAREQYSMAAFPTAFGNIIRALKFEPRVTNAGASLHTLAVETDAGSGVTEVGTVDLPPGSTLVINPVYSYQKSAGVPWTPADVSNLKVGFSAKS